MRYLSKIEITLCNDSNIFQVVYLKTDNPLIVSVRESLKLEIQEYIFDNLIHPIEHIRDIGSGHEPNGKSWERSE